jgi:hypothetical protein
MPSAPHEKENIVSASGLDWKHQQDVKDTTIQEASWSTTPKSSDDSFMLPLPPNFDNLGYELGWHSVKYSQLTKFKADQVPFLVHAHYVWQFTTEVTNAA